MPKPTSLKPMPIRIMQFIVYLMLIMCAVLIIPSSLRVEFPEDANKFLFYSSLFVLTLSLVTIYFGLRKQKFWPTILGGILFLFTSFGIYTIFALFIILLFFLPSTRVYFRRSGKEIEAEPVTRDESSTLEAVEGEVQVEGKLTPKSLVKKVAEVQIRKATPADAETVHMLMLIAFEEYKTAIPPSSALEETEESIAEALHSKEEAAVILYEGDSATAMIRYKYVDNAIFFFRLSVIPSKRRRGYARQLIKWVEKQGVTKGLDFSRCKVRQSIQNNLVLYQDMGYEVVDQELIVRPEGTVKALTMEKKLGV